MSNAAAWYYLGMGPGKGSRFRSEWKRFEDPGTSETVIRMTEPAYSSSLPAHYNRAVSGGWMLFACNRTGKMQAFRMDLKSGETTQFTNADDLDAYSLSILPDASGFVFIAGRVLSVSILPKLTERKVYTVPEPWRFEGGAAIAPDGKAVLAVERRSGGSRLRMIPLAGGEARTLVEAPCLIADPEPRPGSIGVLYRRGDSELRLCSGDGEGEKLALAPGRPGPAYWSSDGKSLLYLANPEDTRQPVSIREYVPETREDTLIARSSQYAQFGFNRDASVFVGASRSVASPAILLMLRVNKREKMLCEHGSSQPVNVRPMFTPDSQCIHFQSDRHGKPALYCIHVDKLVEQTLEG